jgi:hypothetical protein
MRDYELEANLSGCWREIRKIEAATDDTNRLTNDAMRDAFLRYAVMYRHELDRRATA